MRLNQGFYVRQGGGEIFDSWFPLCFSIEGGGGGLEKGGLPGSNSVAPALYAKEKAMST